MKNLTVAQVAKAAGIGKGTIYEYFENKDDIIFQIINIHIEEHHRKFLKEVEKLTTIREKIELFFEFVLSDDPELVKKFNGYKEFLSIVLSDDNLSMKEFNCNKNEFFRVELEKIFAEGIESGELKEESLDLADGILTYQKGLTIRKMSQANYDAKEDFEKFINTIFKLIEVDK
jgi:AcrR family transcriptional regulator